MAKKFFVPPPRKPEPPKEEKPKSYLDKFNARVGKSKVLSAFVIVTIVLGGIATATGNLEKIGKTFSGWFSNKADSVENKKAIDSPPGTLPPDTLPMVKKKFSISGIVLNQEEVRFLEDTLKMEYSANEKGDSIWLDYNGTIEEMTVGNTTRYKYYGSSSIQLMIGNTLCHEFSNGISAYSEDGTTKKDRITTHINNSVANFVRANKDEIFHHIILCLKK